MRYSAGECLADYGFTFLEKIHEPIFLVHRTGRVTRMNEAARKLLSIAKVSFSDLEQLIATHIHALAQLKEDGYQRLKIGDGHLHLIARNLQGSDFILIEVKR